MKLTSKEQKMLSGEMGLARQKAMELLVKYGEALGADSFVDTRNVHSLTPFYFYPDVLNSYLDIKDMDDFISKSVLDSDEKVIIDELEAFTSSHIYSVDLDHLDFLEASKGRDPANFREMVVSMRDYCKKIGMTMMSTCTPYTSGNVPRFGEHCAWTESSAISYLNSVIGGRSNIEGDHSSFASAVTGKTPYWGFHIPENRYGNVIVQVEYQPKSLQDWDLLGYSTGFEVGLDIPIYSNIEQQGSMCNFMALSSAGAASGAIVMYHVLGQTPEAKTLDEALGGRNEKYVITFGNDERKKAYEKLNCAHDEHVEYVVLGCPHYPPERLRKVASLLEGKRINPGVSLLIFTCFQHKALAERNGYLEIIERAGGKVVIDSCPLNTKIAPSRIVATDAAKIAHTSGGMKGWTDVWYGTLEECINAAVTGKWEGELN